MSHEHMSAPTSVCIPNLTRENETTTQVTSTSCLP